MYRCSCNRDRGIRIFIIALIVICALGYLVYSGYIKHNHTSDGDWEIVKEATCTETGVRAKICDVCGKEYETEVIPLAHIPAEPVEENRVDPTHAQGGSYDSVIYCTKCDAEISTSVYTIPPVGHDYDWEIKYDYAKGRFSAEGLCPCEEHGNIITVNEGDKKNKLNVKPADVDECACCAIEYVATVTVDGKTDTCSITLDAPIAEHRVSVVDAEGNSTSALLSDYAHYDEKIGVYYVLTEGVSILHYTDEDDPTRNEWNRNGFAYGIFRCTTCGEYYQVRIYSAEHDTRLQNP